MKKKFIQFFSIYREAGFTADIPLRYFGRVKFTEKEITKMKKLGLRESLVHDEIGAITKAPKVYLKRAVILIQHFGRLENIARASENDLRKVPGIGEKLVKAIISFQPKFQDYISKARAQKDYSFIKECNLAEAIDLTKRFFEEVCNLPQDYDVFVDVVSGEIRCDICGKIIKTNKFKLPRSV